MVTRRARHRFLGRDLCDNCDHPVCCRVRPETTPVPCVALATMQLRRSVHDIQTANVIPAKFNPLDMPEGYVNDFLAVPDSSLLRGLPVMG
jgi:hypothetical protein